MSYIYDIILNFHEHYYNFYEWNKLDKIKNIYKIPLFHINDEDLLSLKNNEVVLDNPFLYKLKEKNKNKKNISFLVSNTNLTIGILINEEGIVEKRSSLLFDEEEEANELSESLPITIINYKKNIKKQEHNKTRIELEKKDSLIKFIKNNKNLITLKYLYYEYYNKECNNIEIIKKTLLKELKEDWNTNQNKLYNIIKILNN